MKSENKLLSSFFVKSNDISFTNAELFVLSLLEHNILLLTGSNHVENYSELCSLTLK